MVKSDSVSICTQVCDRNSFLEQALLTWLSWGPAEIVVFDMPEDERAFEVCEKHGDEKIRVYQADDFDAYNIAKGKNTCVRNTAHEWVLYLDSDTLITEHFPKEMPTDAAHIYSKTSEMHSRLIDFLCDVHDEKEISLNAGGLSGSFFMHRNAFDAVNGFDERMSGYGYEDDDFRNRLATAGLERRGMFFGLRHIPHGNTSRTEKYLIKDKFESWNRNKMLSDMSLWSPQDVQEKFQCQVYEGKNLIGEGLV